MDFISNQDVQIQEMLKAIGVSRIEDLFQSIPEKLRCSRPSLDDGISEFEGIQLMEGLAAKNTYPQFANYLGAGAYEHHIPSMVGPICGKSEFLTSYTPYQPEASQGMLQVIFEFQSVLCALTGMDAGNASVYDGASACAEAMLMALRVNKGRTKIVIPQGLNPRYRGVVDQYLDNHTIEIVSEGIDENTAAVLVQYPNYLGELKDYTALAAEAKKHGALMVICANPTVYGLFKSAAEMGADIAVGDVQPFGLPLEFGGPYAGYMACKQEWVRQLPGRIVGQTVDTNGKRGYVLTLQAREQHIRREKATSNICTNQALAALASLITILWYGKEGVKKLALTNFQRSAYLKRELLKFSGFKAYSSEPCFNEFAIRFPKPITEVQKHFRKHKIEPGVPLDNDFLLVAVTETKTKAQLDQYIKVARSL